MSHYAYTALYLSYAGIPRVFTPDPFILRLSLTDPALVYDQFVNPDPLNLRFSLTEATLLITSPIVFTPDPLILRLLMADPALAYLQIVTPDPLILRLSLTTPVLAPGPVVLEPDPLVLRLLMNRAKLCELVNSPPLEPSVITYIAQLYSPTLGILTMPAQAVQGNARSLGQTEDWSASIPSAAQYLAQIVDYAADADTLLLVKQRTTYRDGSICWDTVARAPLTGWDRNRGSTKYVITLRGQVGGVLTSPTTRALAGLIQENTTVDTSESNSIRVPVDLTIRPGDTVTYGGYLNFTVDRIAYVLSEAGRYMQLTSA
jgi:hypothetical protein